MSEGFPNPQAFEDRTDWRKDRKLARRGFRDLQYLPRSRTGWHATLAALAYSARRRVGRPDLNLWAAMHGCPPSRRYAELGGRALVLWHGTSSRRAEKIRQVGLFPKKGIWATAEPRLAHSFSRGRGTQYAAGSAMIVLVFDKTDIPVAFEMAREGDTLRFRSPLGPEWIEYILWDDRIEFLGRQKADAPRPWGKARFTKRRGKWAPRSRPPVRFDARHAYGDLAGWLELSVRRLLTALGSASAVEIFSSLYAMIDPWDALEHERIFEAIDRLCGPGRQTRLGARLFSLAAQVG